MLDGFHPKSHDKMVKFYGPKKQMLGLSSIKHPSFSFIIQKLIKRVSMWFSIILYHMSRLPTFLSSSLVFFGLGATFGLFARYSSHLYKSPENDLYIYIYIHLYTLFGAMILYTLSLWIQTMSEKVLKPPNDSKLYPKHFLRTYDWIRRVYIHDTSCFILPRFGMAVTHCHSAWGCESGPGAVCLGQVRAQAAGTKDQRNKKVVFSPGGDGKL